MLAFWLSKTFAIYIFILCTACAKNITRNNSLHCCDRIFLISMCHIHNQQLYIIKIINKWLWLLLWRLRFLEVLFKVQSNLKQRKKELCFVVKRVDTQTASLQHRNPSMSCSIIYVEWTQITLKETFVIFRVTQIIFTAYSYVVLGMNPMRIMKMQKTKSLGGCTRVLQPTNQTDSAN